MPHPRSKTIPVADFSRGTNQAPGFMRRAQGAAEEMVNLVVGVDGRPELRKGFTPIDADSISLGANNGRYANTDEYDQLIVAHWLGDMDTPNGIKRLYCVPRDASWVQDEGGRLIFIVIPDVTAIFIDVKLNRVFDWVLRRPSNAPGIRLDRTLADELPDAQRGSIYKKISDIAIVPNPFISEAVITVDVAQDVQFSISIWSSDGKIKDLSRGRDADMAGSPSQPQNRNSPYTPGRYQFVWDGRNAQGEQVAIRPDYYAVLTDGDGTVVRIERGAFVGADKVQGLTEQQTIEQFVGNLEEKAIDDGELKGGIGFRSGNYTLCYTYASSEYHMETRPSPIDDVYVYAFSDVRYEDDENESLSRAPVKIDVQIDNELPEWANEVRIYAKRGRALSEIKEAIETGWDFDLVGTITRSHLDTSTGTTFTWENEQRAEPFDLLDSYDHDGPPMNLRTIENYGIGIWGSTINQIYFTKIGDQGDQRIYTFPHENTLVPHDFPLSRSGQSPIMRIHAAAHDSALLAFKRDAIHIIRGKGLITGLYDPNTPVNVDIDASGVIDGTGTSSPRTIVTVGNAVYFVGSDKRFWRYGLDWRGNTRLTEIGLPIQKYLDDVADDELETLSAFLFQNCYHLITPRRLIVMDMSREYWTSFNWLLKDAFWSRGGWDAESILYGLDQNGAILTLYDGETDDGEPIPAVWRSNPVGMPSESVINGVIAVHTVPNRDAPLVKCRVDVDDQKGAERKYYPRSTNHYRCGMHKIGSRASVQLEVDKNFPKFDRIQIEVFPR